MMMMMIMLSQWELCGILFVITNCIKWLENTEIFCLTHYHWNGIKNKASETSKGARRKIVYISRSWAHKEFEEKWKIC